MTRHLTALTPFLLVSFFCIAMTTAGFSESKKVVTKPTILSMHKKYDNKLIDIKNGKVVTEIQKDKVADLKAGIVQRQVQPKQPEMIYITGKKADQKDKPNAAPKKYGHFTIK